MFDLYELRAFTEFASCGTLSKAADNLHISQPTLTRVMKHIESEFGVNLFVRTKNRIELNETGKIAAAQAVRLLDQADNMAEKVRSFDRSLHTITIEACAPVPLGSLLQSMTSAFADSTISSSLREITEILKDVRSGECRIGIAAVSEGESTDSWKEFLTGAENEKFCILPYLQENLYLSLRPDHPLADRKEVTCPEINGMTFLVRSELGFWGNIHHRMIPDSTFLAQEDESGLYELLKNSTIPGFVTNITMKWPNALKGRKYVPISDPRAHITYYLICSAEDSAAGFLKSISELTLLL